jgi:hypothetical protein
MNNIQTIRTILNKNQCSSILIYRSDTNIEKRITINSYCFILYADGLYHYGMGTWSNLGLLIEDVYNE